ncbi:MAG: hypothetical protein M4579_002487 [Chaenotheca gracillima]|nr:MAG: hypothetical protein M4579_002487 [Chaenotheca gracillima]
MHLSRHALVLLPLCVPGALADWLGPTYPAPVDLSSNTSLVSIAWKNLTSTFDSYFKDHKNTTLTAALVGAENTTFSAGLFSLHDHDAEQLQYHYTAPEIANAKNGTQKVDADSIYRVASVSKLITVLAGLVSLTDEDWNRPLTDIFPELDEAARRGRQNPTESIQWDNVTPWALAAQIAGVPHEGWPAADILVQVAALVATGQPGGDPVTTLGFPPVELDTLGPCWNLSNLNCAPNEFLEAVGSQPPLFQPWTTPAYADDGFMLLGIIISNITGKSMDTIYRESIFDPLGMTSSNSLIPSSEADLARSVIAGDPIAGFAIDQSVTTPSGGIFSTTSDLSKLGVAILNSTLLCPNQTRKWMKPISHTASLTYSIGAPWEILRYVDPSTGKVTDLYTKLGDSGYYGGTVVLIPEYGAGFTGLEAYTGASRGPAANIFFDYIITAILPALEAQAAAEAARNYVGTYTATDSKLNSSVTVAFNESTAPGASSGLSVTSWISNGTDLLATALFDGVKPRLLATIPNESADQGARKVAFQVSVNPQLNSYFAPGAVQLGAIGPFSGDYNTNFDWLTADQQHYAGIGVNLFVFEVDEKGNATAVSPAVTRATLKREG